jgi:hypothetical protein
MSESSNYSNNSQTLVIDADEFSYETVEQENGRATVVRFPLKNPQVRPGDVLLILSGSDIHFHGMIESVDVETATANDRRGSLLPADTVQ